METIWTVFIVTMHPPQDRLFLPVDALGPLAGILLVGADHIQGLKAFAGAWMFSFDG